MPHQSDLKEASLEFGEQFSDRCRDVTHTGHLRKNPFRSGVENDLLRCRQIFDGDEDAAMAGA
jgi:hypothetical protein